MKRKPYPITDLTGGLTTVKDPLFLLDKESPNIKCARLYKGLITKDMGWQTFGCPLLGVPMLIDSFYENDGDKYLFCFTTTSAYTWNATNLEWEDRTEGVVIDECETAWTGSANVTTSRDSTDFKRGVYSSKLIIAANFTTGLAAYFDYSELNISTYTHIHFLIKSSIALAAGDVQLLLDDSSGCVSPLETLDVPALVASTWTRVSVALAAKASDTALISVGLNVAVDKGACTIHIDNIRAVKEFTGTNMQNFSTAILNDTYIITNGADSMKKFNTDTTMQDLGGSPPIAKSVVAYKDHLVVCYTTEASTPYPRRIRWSSAGTIETWTGGTAGYNDTDDTVDFATSLFLQGDKCFLYKERSIWDVSYVGGADIFRPIKKLDDVGTLAPKTISGKGENVLFYAHDGIYLFDQTRADPISDSILPLLYQTGDKIVNLEKAARINAVYTSELREYWVCVPTTGDDPDTLFKYNFTHKSLIRRDSVGITCMGKYEVQASVKTWSSIVGTWADAKGTWKSKSLSKNAPTILLGYTTGQVYEDNRSTPTTDTFVFETKDFLFGQAMRIRSVEVEARLGGFMLCYSTDGGITWSAGQTFAYQANWTNFSFPIDITTQLIRFKIEVTAQEFELKWIQPWYISRAREISLQTS